MLSSKAQLKPSSTFFRARISIILKVKIYCKTQGKFYYILRQTAIKQICLSLLVVP